MALGRRLLVLTAGSLLALAALASWPVDTAGLAPRLAPVASYEEALRRIEVLQRRDTEAINPLCRTRLLSHGRKVTRAAVLFHGFTTCPQQFELMGQLLVERGYNVLIPRLPHHGLADRLTEDLAGLTAAELAAAADEAVDIARGLGDEIAVAGLSSGGVMTAWVAQNRPDVRRAVVIAPVFAPAGSPLLAQPVTNLALTLPNRFVWWSEETRLGTVGPYHAYPRYATRAAGEVMRLGYAVADQAARRRPAGGAIAVVTIGGDPAVGNERTGQIARQWRALGGDVVTFEFPAHLNLLHDAIDPAQTRQQVAVVYPKVLELIGAS